MAQRTKFATMKKVPPNFSSTTNLQTNHPQGKE
jgi:hypothetical protein